MFLIYIDLLSFGGGFSLAKDDVIEVEGTVVEVITKCNVSS